jgi:hypothetical protein
VNTNKTPASNGYGSFINEVVVRVDTEHVETFSDAFDIKPVKSTTEHSDFIVNVYGRYRGDDATVLYEIDYRLPNSIPRSAWSVLWGESSY